MLKIIFHYIMGILILFTLSSNIYAEETTVDISYNEQAIIINIEGEEQKYIRADGNSSGQIYDCDYYSNQALDLVMDGEFQDWELNHGLNICSYFALEALKEIRDRSYIEWEMKWATQVNNKFALEAFIEIRDWSYKEWELKWATHVNSSRELKFVRNLRKGRYSEEQLKRFVLLDE